MPEPADRLFVDIVANMEPFITSLEEGMNTGKKIAEDGARDMTNVFEQVFGEPIRKMLDEIAEAQRKAFGQIDIQALAGLENRLQSIAKLGVDQGKSVQDIMGNMNKVADDYKQGLDQSAKFSDILALASQKLGFNIAGLVQKFGTVAGAITLAITAIKQLNDLVKESIAIALRYEESQVRLARAVNKFRTSADDSELTLGLVNEKVAELSDRFGLSTLQAEGLLSTTLKMTRELGITGDQALEFAESATVLAENSDDAESAMRRLVYFMRTGVSRGLTQLGITISDTELQHLALSKGIRVAVDDMDSETRAALALEIITQKAAEATGDAEKAAQTYSARLKQIETDSTSLKAVLGDVFVDPFVKSKEAAGKLTTTILQLVTLASIGIRFLIDQFVTLEKAIYNLDVELIGKILAGDLKGAQDSIADFWQDLPTVMQNGADAFNRELALAATGGVDFGETTVEAFDAATESWDEFVARVDLALPEIIKALDELEAETLEKTAAIEQAFQDAMDDIALDFAQRRIDAATNLARDLNDIDQESSESRIQAIIDAQVEEFRTIEDHKLALLQLEQQYLMNLEDAVRERDARQVLLLQRNFKAEKGQLETDTDLRLKRQREDFQIQLAEIERQRQIRRAERIEAYNEEREDIATDEERKRVEAEERRNREMRDLGKANNDKRNLILGGLINTATAAKQGLDNILKLFNSYMGPGGALEQVYKYASSLSGAYPLSPQAGAMQQQQQFVPSPFGMTLNPAWMAQQASLGGSNRTYYRGGQQRGGSFIATSPQMITVGEGSPERVDVTPLSMSTGMPRTGAGSGQSKTSVEIGIDLSEGLTGEIVDQAMGEMADVFVKLNQGQKRAAR